MTNNTCAPRQRTTPTKAEKRLNARIRFYETSGGAKDPSCKCPGSRKKIGG